MDDESLIKDIIYKRKNGENIVNDPEAIKSCKNEQNRDIIDNARLGSYDKFGNYVIIPDIKSELISLPKIVYTSKTSGNSTVYELRSKLPIFGDLFFKLTIGPNQAALTLTETVTREAGGYNEIYDEFIDALALGKERLPDSIIFRNYNVIEEQADHGQREDRLDCRNILTRKVYLNLLSKELKKVSTFDEHDAFNKMVSLLKSAGEYGNRVLSDFVTRLKDRPGIFEISDSDNYNKAVNEVLLSSLDITTTKEDKEDPKIHEVYLGVLNARNESIEEDLKKANALVDENYVEKTVLKATTKQEDQFEQGAEDEFLAQMASDKAEGRRRPDKPILKQGKESKKTKSQGKTKEDKIKSILDKKKKTPSNKKLSAAKKAQKSQKLKAKKKSASKAKGKSKAKAKKKPTKAKVKNAKKKVKKNKNQTKKKSKLKAKKPAKKKAKKAKAKVKGKKKVKKAKAPQRAKAKAGSLKSSKGGATKSAAKKKKKNYFISNVAFSGMVNSQMPSVSTSSGPVSQMTAKQMKNETLANQKVEAKGVEEGLSSFVNKVNREKEGPSLSTILQDSAKIDQAANTLQSAPNNIIDSTQKPIDSTQSATSPTNPSVVDATIASPILQDISSQVASQVMPKSNDLNGMPQATPVETNLNPDATMTLPPELLQ